MNAPFTDNRLVNAPHRPAPELALMAKRWSELQLRTESGWVSYDNRVTMLSNAVTRRERDAIFKHCQTMNSQITAEFNALIALSAESSLRFLNPPLQYQAEKLLTLTARLAGGSSASSGFHGAILSEAASRLAKFFTDQFLPANLPSSESEGQG